MHSDELDQQLVGLLLADARLSTAELARRLGIARSTVQTRLERLERNGTIQGYTLKLNSADPRKAVRAHVSIRVSPREQAGVERRLAKLDGIETLYSVSGMHDLIAILTAASTAELDQRIDAIRDCEGVTETLSAIILSTRASRG